MVEVNCFVVMPFAEEFDDVYATIKRSVEEAAPAYAGRCFRLDEHRPAGRIPHRLLVELKSATLCIADLTGTRPNVMWEVGYAMALECPTILLTQSLNEIPFDIREMETLTYERTRLSATLGKPLHKMILDTLTAHNNRVVKMGDSAELAGELLKEMSELKGLVGQIVSAWDTNTTAQKSSITEINNFEGAWLDECSGSHFYIKMINGQMIIPYCYGDDNELTGIFYDWEKIGGEYWFGRFRWMRSADISGFAFIKEEDANMLRGHWWMGEELKFSPNSYREKNGVSLILHRLPDKRIPHWVAKFFNDVKKHGLIGLIP